MDNVTIESCGLWEDFLRVFENSVILGEQAVSAIVAPIQ